MKKRQTPWYRLRKPSRRDYAQFFDMLLGLCTITWLFPFFLNGSVILDGWRLTIFSLVAGLLLSTALVALILFFLGRPISIAEIKKSYLRYLIYCTTSLSPMLSIFINEIPTNKPSIQATSIIDRVVEKRIRHQTTRCVLVNYEGHELEIGLPDDQRQLISIGGQIRYEIREGRLWTRYVGDRAIVK